MSMWDRIKKISEAFLEKLKKLDYERLAIGLLALPALFLLIAILFFAPELLELAWVLTIFKVLAEYASYIAGGAYMGRLLNLILNGKGCHDKNKKYIKDPQEHEKLFTSVGMLYGMMFAITLIVFGAGIPYFNLFSYGAYFLFILGYVCGLGGLSNRLGSTIDGSRLPPEKKAIIFGVILGVVASIALITFLAMTGTLPFVVVAGLSKAFFDLFVLNKTLFYIGFFLGITGATVSCFDYFSKAWCFLKYCLGTGDNKLKDRVESKRHEYRGAFFGLLTGLLLTVGIITFLVLTGGLGGVAPFVIGATAFIITITCTSIVAALFSRIGKVLDGIWPSSKMAKVHKFAYALIARLEQLEIKADNVNKSDCTSTISSTFKPTPPPPPLLSSCSSYSHTPLPPSLSKPPSPKPTSTTRSPC